MPKQEAHVSSELTSLSDFDSQRKYSVQHIGFSSRVSPNLEDFYGSQSVGICEHKRRSVSWSLVHWPLPTNLYQRPRLLFRFVRLRNWYRASRSNNTTEQTQLFTVIPYACASAVILISIFSDRINVKGPFLLGTLLLSCVGYIVLLCEVSVAGKIVAVCIATSGLYTSVILLQAWIVANMAGYSKRATAWAMAEIFGQCFGIMASHIYTTPPRFIKGHAIVLGLLLFAAAMTVCLMWWMRRANLQKEAEVAEYESEGRVHPHRLKSLEDVQDLHIDFRYII